MSGNQVNPEQGMLDLNQRMRESKSRALPLGECPMFGFLLFTIYIRLTFWKSRHIFDNLFLFFIKKRKCNHNVFHILDPGEIQVYRIQRIGTSFFVFRIYPR